MELAVLLFENRLQLEQPLAFVLSLLVNLVDFLHLLVIQHHLLVILFLRVLADVVLPLWCV